MLKKGPLPALDRLHERHPGFNRPICEAYAEAAAVCLDESHTPPVDFTVAHDQSESLRGLAWAAPDARALASWGNSDDTTRDGAYSVGLATAEAELGFVALARSDVRTGADYYIGPPGSELEDAHRLEISGLRHGEKHEVHSRLREKIKQAAKGDSTQPALACTVGFRAKLITLARVQDAERRP